jgi:hypothetical protein
VPADILFRALRFLFSLQHGPAWAEVWLSLCNEAKLAVLLAKRIFQRGDTGKIVLFFLKYFQWIKGAVFGWHQPSLSMSMVSGWSRFYRRVQKARWTGLLPVFW